MATQSQEVVIRTNSFSAQNFLEPSSGCVPKCLQDTPQLPSSSFTHLPLKKAVSFAGSLATFCAHVLGGSQWTVLCEI